MWITNKLENRQFVMFVFKQTKCLQTKTNCDVFIIWLTSRKVLTEILARSPGFDVSLSHFTLFKILKFSCLCL